MHTNILLIGGFAEGNYWTSTEVDDLNADAQDFSPGGFPSSESKASTFYVRAIRSF